jgi:hypothetical protein
MNYFAVFNGNDGAKAESKMHKIMRFHEITPGANFNQIQSEFKYIIAHSIGKRFMGYMSNDCWTRK